MSKKNDEDIINWLETELDYAHSELAEATTCVTRLEKALTQYQSKGSLSPGMRKKYNEMVKEREEWYTEQQ